MMEPLISVIIPVYNVEDYLRECLDSVVGQTYKNLEIIVVDDGSTDSSGQICDEYANKDERIKVIHKENGGLSDARNAGLDICTGEYIGFVDSDDYIKSIMYERMYNVAEKENADIVGCHQVWVIDGNVRSAPRENNLKYTNYDDKAEMIRYMLNSKGLVSACFKLYKRKIFSEVRFFINRTSEDAFFITDSVKKAQRMTVITDELYYYRMRIGSITHKRQWNKHIWDPIASYKYNMEIIKKEYPSIITEVEKRLFWSYRICIAYAGNAADYEEHKDETENVRKEFRCCLPKVLSNKLMTSKNVIDCILAMYLPVRFYGYLSNYFRK
ncbi:glycosyltransferase [Selenomonas ruminantium]|uniref:glycosyltransferase family 2 protein n=1 Tax=Selenomonas ruminantium TaxID=971 RepID=UPI0026F0194A|nr:glycosyltransferase [Selenomonas ruminantium]